VRRLLEGALLAVACAVPAGALEPGDHLRTLVHGGAERLYTLRVPAGHDGVAPIPLLLDIHGYLSNRSQQRALSGLAALADAEGFAVVWPQGRFGAAGDAEASNPPAGPSWNGGWCCGSAATEQPDDVGFLRTLVEAVAREIPVDRRRVYASGLSNGGEMTQRLACEAADVFAAAAPVAFPIGLQPITACAPSRPIAVLAFQGLTDALVPYEGGGPFYSAAESFAHWRAAGGCGSGAVEEEVVQGASRCDTNTSCAEGVEVGLCSITSTFTLPIAAGHILYINDDFDLAALIWAFVSRFALPAEPAPLPALVAGKKLALRDGPDPSRRKLGLALRNDALALDPALDPTADGASFQVWNSAGSGEALCLALPAAGWTRKGSGFSYRDPGGASGPCRSAKLRAGRLEVACSGKAAPLDYSLDEPVQGGIAVRLASGPQAFCASFGGRVERDTGTAAGKARFLAKGAPAPAACPVPGTPCP
jgi:polyhydroxybutyrate depolymerase